MSLENANQKQSLLRERAVRKRVQLRRVSHPNYERIGRANLQTSTLEESTSEQ